MKIIINFLKAFCIVFIMFLASQASAQNDTKTLFPAYTSFLSKAMNISWVKPKGFIDTKASAVIWGPLCTSSLRGPSFIYRFTFQSKKGDCLILYPGVDALGTMSIPYTPARVQMISEVYAAVLGIEEYKFHEPEKNPPLDLDKYVKLFTGDEVCKSISADTVYIANLPLVKSYQGKYSYCTGVYIQKNDRPVMSFKCFFTQEGRKNEKVYVRQLLNTVKYKGGWKYNKEKWTKLYDYYLKDMVPK